MTDSFTVLDSLPSHIAVVNSSGVILATNRMWDQFSNENGGTAARCCAGANYFETCAKAAERGDPTGHDVLREFEQIQHSIKDTFCLEYPCHSPTEERWFSVRGSLLRDGSGSIVVVHDNITQRVRSDKAMRQSQTKYLTLLDAVADAVVVANPQGAIVRVNPTAAKMFGYSPEELTGQNVEILMPAAFQHRHVQHRQTFVENPRKRPMGVGMDLWGLRKNGTQFPLEISLSPIATEDGLLFFSMISDMTEARKTQSQLALLSSIVRSAEEGIVGTDLQGLVVSWNHTAERIFGYSEQDALGRHLIFVFPPDRQQQFLEKLSRIELREYLPRYESPCVRKDGSRFDALITLSPIDDGNGKLLGMSSIYLDVTERKRTYDALQMAKQAAEIANRTKSEFLSNMSHELRTPMNGIIGLTDVVLDTELNTDQRDYVVHVKHSAEALLAILSKVLEISDLQSGKYIIRPRQFRLRDFIDATMKEFDPAALAKKLRLGWYVQADAPEMLIGDSDCLRQVLSNLVENAIKFTDLGDVDVTVEFLPQLNNVLSISVRDTGIGVSPEHKRVIFEPFHQADNSFRRRFGGTGLGLAICTQLAEAMGGRIWVESDGRTGSTFRVAVLMDPVDKARENIDDEATVQPAGPGATQDHAIQERSPQEHTGQEDPGQERRSSVRKPTNDPAEIRVLRPFSPHAMQCQILDVSKSGMKARVGQTLDEGSLVQVNLRDTLVIGEVRYCSPAGSNFHMGLEILSLRNKLKTVRRTAEFGEFLNEAI